MIILASASPRRQELLQQIGCEFRVVVSDVEEAAGQSMTPEKLVLHNACLKASAVARNLVGQSVLGADTVVSLDGRIYGKPKDAEEAKEMLCRLSGREHQVSTGVALVRDGAVWQAVETTSVRFLPLSTVQMEAYIATGEPMDKAGAYAIQGRAAVFIQGIAGSYSNVVGLPLSCVAQLAGKAGINLYGDNGKGFTSG